MPRWLRNLVVPVMALALLAAACSDDDGGGDGGTGATGTGATGETGGAAECNADLKVGGSDAQRLRRERHYIRGQTVTQRRAKEHQTGLTLQEFVDKRK